MSYYAAIPKFMFDCSGHPSMKHQYLLIVLLFTLSACGFQLRGSQQKVSVQKTKVYVVTTAAQKVGKIVRSKLAGAGASAVASEAAAKYTLKLEHEVFNRTVLSVSAATGKVGQYQLALTVTMSVTDATGKVLLAAEPIDLVRDYTFDEDAVLGKFEEQDLLQDEMAKQAAAQILRRLSDVTKAR